MKVLCATPECKWCDEDYYCTAEEVHLSSTSIMTVWEGRQELWRCKQFEMSERARAVKEFVGRMIGGRSNDE